MSRKKTRCAPSPVVQDQREKLLAVRSIASEATFDPETYLYDDSFKPGNPSDFRSVHTMAELLECIRTTEVDAEGIFLEVNSQGVYRYKRLNKKQILESSKSNARIRKLREARIHEDAFASDSYPDNAGANAGLVGDDYVPLLGGVFFHQQYLQDYLRGLSYCFHEYHHHPLARAVVHITRDFVLGRGYRVDSEDQKALALWRAFEETNKLEELIEQVVLEGSIYGENLIWWLPNQEVNIAYDVQPGQEPGKGVIPRIRLIDPATCWEIVTFPEDITRVISYNLVYPTQYQIYTGTSGGKGVPTSKFIMQQLPAEDVMHFKYNCVSNEKRGRSDLFPILGYLKWIRDCVNYKLISLKKQSAWTEDIEVEGSQNDVDNLTSSLQQLGTFEPAGSRFIHTSKIKRSYLANQSGGSGDDSTLSWGISMVAAGSGIPTSYFGLEKSAGQTKASAIVGTEPVSKKFERRQIEVGRILQALWRKFQDKYGVKGSECRVAFPEIISQDSSSKLKDIKFAEDCGYISKKTAAPLAAKEIGGLDNYDYEVEEQAIKAEDPGPVPQTLGSPLTAPSLSKPSAPAEGQGSTSALTKADRVDTAKGGVK